MSNICSYLFSNGTKVVVHFIQNTLFIKNGLFRFFQADNIRRLGSVVQHLIDGLPIVLDSFCIAIDFI